MPGEKGTSTFSDVYIMSEAFLFNFVFIFVFCFKLLNRFDELDRAGEEGTVSPRDRGPIGEV